MDTSDFEELGYLSISDNYERNVQYFDYTGKSLLHPITYSLCEFQKDIILTAVRHNSLVILPPGVGKLFIAAVLVNNFQRWFLNGRILILSQTKSYLSDLISALNDYTSLNKDSYLDLSGNLPSKRTISILDKTIVLTTPQKCVDLMINNEWKFQNIVLLLIFETSKIVKCDDYQKILDSLKRYEYRTLLFVEPAGINFKIVKQVVEDFNIYKLVVKTVESSDIKKCTHRSEIETVPVDVYSHITDFKCSFFSVFEKYAKKLKDKKVISGNVSSLTKPQILKAKERFQKSSSFNNMLKAERDELIDSMTMGAFLCFGIDILHNWGVRAFHSYLLDEEKDNELKELISKDEHLIEEVKKLNDYLKLNNNKIDTSPSLIVHPKVLHVKEIISDYFSKPEEEYQNVRIIVLCPLDSVVDDLDRLFRNFPDSVRYHCIKTKAKNLASEPAHKEIAQNLLDGVINVLVVSNLVDEVMEIKSSLIISLEPYKTLLRNADPRFFEGPVKCTFILTKGSEYMRFESYLNEKRTEQKAIDVLGILTAENNVDLFPNDFDPEFESSGVSLIKKDFRNSPGQKTLFQYTKTKESPLLFDNSNVDCSTRENITTNDDFSIIESQSLFADTTFAERSKRVSLTRKLANDEDLIPLFPEKKAKLIPFFSPVKKKTDTNSFSPEKKTQLIRSFLPEKKSCSISLFSPNKKTELVSSFTSENNAYQACLSSSKEKNIHLNTADDDNDSFDELILDFTDSKVSKPYSRKSIEKENTPTPQSNIVNSQENKSKKPSWMSKPSKVLNFSRCVSPEFTMKTIVTEAQVHHNVNENTVTTTSQTKAFKKKEKTHPVISIQNLRNETFTDFLFSDSSRESSEEPENNNSNIAYDTNEESVFCKFDNSTLNYEDLHKITVIEEDVAESLNYVSKQDVDAEDSEKVTCPAMNCQQFDIDSDCEIVPDSPKSKRLNENFSSKYFESCTQNAEKSQSDIKSKSQTTNKGVCDLFPDTTTIDETRFSPSYRENNTFSQLIQSKSESKRVASSAISLAEIPSNFFDDLDIYDLSFAKNTPQIKQSLSPVLSHSRRSNFDRDRSKLQLSNNQSSSIHFNSSWESANNLSKTNKTDVIDKNSARQKCKASQLFSSLIDDDDDLFTNISKTVIQKIDRSDINQHSVNSCSTPRNRHFTPCSLLKSQIPKEKTSIDKQMKNDNQNIIVVDGNSAVNNFKTPDRLVLPSDDCTPDLNFDDYSTPEFRKSEKKNSLWKSKEMMRPAKITSFFKSTIQENKNSSVNFTNDSFSFDGFSTPDRITLKDRSPSIHSESSISRVSATILDTPPSNLNSSKERKFSTMDRLNRISTRGSPSDTSNFIIDSPSSKSIRPKSTSLYKNLYTQKLKIQEDLKHKKNSISSPSPAIRNDIIDSDDDIIWLNSSPRNNSLGKLNTLFKKPNNETRHSTPVSNSSNSSTPEFPIKRPQKKKGKLKRNLQFFDKEAAVSGDDSGDEDDGIMNESQLSVDSFIDDDTKKLNMPNYLKSLRSPHNVPGRFHIPILSESRMRKDVFSQVENYEQSYVNDSFCVDDDMDYESEEHTPSVLTQMEAKLAKKKNNRTEMKFKAQPSKYKRIMMNTSPDSPESSCIRLKTRKRIKCFSDSDSDAD